MNTSGIWVDAGYRHFFRFSDYADSARLKSAIDLGVTIAGYLDVETASDKDHANTFESNVMLRYWFGPFALGAYARYEYFSFHIGGIHDLPNESTHRVTAGPELSLGLIGAGNYELELHGRVPAPAFDGASSSYDVELEAGFNMVSLALQYRKFTSAADQAWLQNAEMLTLGIGLRLPYLVGGDVALRN